MVDLSQAPQIARRIAMDALGGDPGPMAGVESLSHHVYVGADVVVKIIDAARSSRLSREIALATQLPRGLTAALLAHGTYQNIRYACYAREPGTALAMGLPGADVATARSLAEQAVRRLGVMHGWTPSPAARQTLAEPLNHGGFVSRSGLLEAIDNLATVVSPALFKGLTALAQNAPASARTDVPVHADCHWGNWLASGGTVTALLDFEWARLGEPVDDWFFIIAFSGTNRDAVLDVVVRETTTVPETLRAECEVRHAAHLVADITRALTNPGEVSPHLLPARLDRLREVVEERCWWA
jgi:aminoglycoside phosphotransferase (APT) family kinase protein